VILKNIKYILYKLVNNAYSYLFLTADVPLVFIKGRHTKFNNELLIDFCHSTTHLGDRLFFIPLVQSLLNHGVKVKILDDGLFSKLYLSVVGSELPNQSVSDLASVLIIKPSLLNKREIYPNSIVIDFTDERARNEISYQLVESMSILFGISLEFKKIYRKQVNRPVNFLESASKYIVFNNYIDSGRFRKFFLNLSKLDSKCIFFKKMGYKIIHVGSDKDKKLDGNTYNFVDMDLRGALSIVDLIDIISSKNVFGVVTFDNFIMHIAHIFSKKTWVLFRGRFSKSQYFHHMKFVNSTFLQDKRSMTYL
jgi:hypothetical protein